uniref:DUF5641 domain-containing protein n=1 Tax=Steinernema glaseri TaxID=37863 RepID=A0A1I8A498_9BILA
MQNPDLPLHIITVNDFTLSSGPSHNCSILVKRCLPDRLSFILIPNKIYSLLVHMDINVAIRQIVVVKIDDCLPERTRYEPIVSKFSGNQGTHKSRVVSNECRPAVRRNNRLMPSSFSSNLVLGDCFWLTWYYYKRSESIRLFEICEEFENPTSVGLRMESMA